MLMSINLLTSPGIKVLFGRKHFWDVDIVQC